MLKGAPTTLLNRSTWFVVPAKQRDATRRKRYFRITNRARSIELNQVIDQRVFPDGMSRTRCLPGFHGLAIGATAACNPGEKFDHQLVCRFRHDAPQSGCSTAKG